MTPPAHKRSYWQLVVPLLFAALYRGWFLFRPDLTGNYRVDGLLGVVLGLYIGARAAANFLDLLLLYSRNTLFRGDSLRALLLWLAANILTLSLAFLLVLFALRQFFR